MTLGVFLGISLGASSALARCSAPLAAGAPPVKAQHIFCGELRHDGKATGFHSRPGGQNPPSVSETEDRRADPKRPGIYTLYRFRITDHGRSGVKTMSTMFPDHCDADAVIAAIRHAWNTGTRQDRSFSGQSGPTCHDGNDKPFRIRGFTGMQDGRIVIVTAYPN
jgi:hypothetical protein